MMPTLKISSDQNGKRLDVLLARAYPDYSRSFLQKWIKEGRVTRSGKELIANYRVRVGETIDVVDFSQTTSPLVGEVERSSGGGTIVRRIHPPSQPSPTRGEGVLVSPAVLYEDDSLLVLNKPAGLVVHPAPSHKGMTLVDWLEDYLGPKVTGLFSDASRLGVVHRLDKDTTGVLLVAKTVIAQHIISKQFQDRKVKKTYAAFIEGIPKAASGIISAPVGRSQNVPSRMAVSSQGRPSETTFEVVETFKEASQVSLHPKTGRTHQIRVHCAAIGHPIVGDRQYGAQNRWLKDYGIARPLLHAERLEVQHPVTRKKISFEALWPKDMKQALKFFRASSKALLLVLSLQVGAHAETVKHKTTQAAGPATGATEATSSTKSLKRQISSLKEQFKSLIEEVSALQDRVTGIQSSLDELGASGRLRDLEKAVSDLNGKAVNTANVTEETKTQVLDLSRKLKNQQEALDQLRDQVDHLQQQMIQTKAHEDATPPAASPSGGTEERGSGR